MSFEPLVMPFQDKPFNGDTTITREFLALKEKFDIKVAIETGTCLGYTTLWLAENFEMVKSVESHPEYFAIAKNRLKDMTNVELVQGKSELNLPSMLVDGMRSIFFLDAHWGEACPLEEELDIIAWYTETEHPILEPIIAIHDFQVPDNPDLGYDSYKDQPFTFEWLKRKFDGIYGEGNYTHYYNSELEGAQRGIIYVIPKK